MKIIDETGEQVVDVTHRTVPFSISVTGEGAKTIELSMDGGQSYVPAELDFETDVTLGLSVSGKLTTIKLTAPEGSEWRIW